MCPPIDAEASQQVIREHYRTVIDATSVPIAVYQLPQVTRCRIEHQTLADLARTGRVSMFKDTSGEDAVANGGRLEGVTYVRGAEGGYIQALSPSGPYDGWLLSTGNVFGSILKRILALRTAGDLDAAAKLSADLTEVVQEMFTAAGPLAFGNPFSNANRAGDHVLAYGTTWRSQPRPLTISGDRLPDALLEAAEVSVGKLQTVRSKGYMDS